MKKKLLLFALFVSATVTSCQYDDSSIWNAVDDLETRVESLEASVTKTNEDLVALQAIVTALQNNVSVSSVVTNSDGYTINFSDGTTAEIKNGENAPEVSIKQDTDGVYYWTLGGEWLLDANEAQIKVEGVTPQISINATSLEWEFSLDGGLTWQSTGVVAKGDAGDSFFKSVDSTSSSEYVIFTLADGTEIYLEKYSELSFSVANYTLGTVLNVESGSTTTLAVTMTGVVEYIMDYSSGWDVTFDGATLSVTAPSTDATSGEVSFILNSATGSLKIVKISLLTSEFNVLTFEDTYSGTYWASLIDPVEYYGSLLYNNEAGYNWVDQNTSLSSGIIGADFWNGGHAISNYVLSDYTSVGYTQQLSVTPASGDKGGNNGSEKFAIVYFMTSEYAMDNLEALHEYIPVLKLSDGSEKTFDHIYVNNTSYMLSSIFYGDGYTDPYDTDDIESEYIKLCVYGFDKDGNKAGKVEMSLLDEDTNTVVTDWTKLDLTSLGAVNSIALAVDGNNYSWGYFNRPAYVAYDDVAIQW